MKLCFVIMGFGKKTDTSNGRTLDLDKTYKNIIQPCVINCGFQCVRADEIQDSGIIDKSMYALLMQADLVIADISTNNPNAIYELGIRHAVRPFSTIILKEKDGKMPFDLDHTRMFVYSHLGDDIGADEAMRCQNELSQLIRKVTKNKAIDSPLYEFINTTPPVLPETEYNAIIRELADREKHIFAIVDAALKYMSDELFDDAFKSWSKASTLVPSEPYFIQQRALCKYKSKIPSENTALVDALNIIGSLGDGNDTNDPETLGITGAIYKNLWLLEQDREYLNRALIHYKRAFVIRGDYYTGENYALCLNFLEKQEVDNDEKVYLKIEAKKVRTEILFSLESELEKDDFARRSDKRWVYATLSQCNFAIGNIKVADYYLDHFLRCNPDSWEKKTFEATRSQLQHLLQF